MQAVVPLACFLSVIRPPGVQYENALLQISPVDKAKCPFVKSGSDIVFELFTRHNPTVFQELVLGDDEKLFASSIDFHDKTVVYFHAWMETPEDSSGLMLREAYMQRGDTNVIMVDARHLEAGPWYFTAAQNTWYIGRYAAQFIDYLVTRGLNLNNTHLVGHSLGAQAAGVAGSALKSGRVARITGLDPALPLFDGLPLAQRLDPTDADFVDIIHTDAGIFGYKAPMGHADFYPNGGISPQPGCELEVVLHQQMLLNKCDAHRHTQGFYTYYLTDRKINPNTTSIRYKIDRTTNIDDFFHTEVDKSTVKAKRTLSSENEDIKFNIKEDGIRKKVVKNKDNGKRTLCVKENGAELNKRVKRSELNVDFDNTKLENAKNDEKNDLIANINKYIDIKGLKLEEDEQKSELRSNISKNLDVKELKIDNLDQKREFIAKFDNKNNTEDAKLNKIDDINKLLANIDIDDIKLDTTNKNKEIIKESNIITITKRNPDTQNEETDRQNEEKAISNNNIPEKQIAPIKINFFNPNPIPRLILRTIINRNRSNKRKSIKNTQKKQTFLQKINNMMPKLFKNQKTPNKIAKILKKRPETDNKIPFFNKQTLNSNPLPNIFKNLNNNAPKNHVVKRQKRFLSLFKSSEDTNNNFILKMLDFLVKNRKNVLPVLTVMREINTIVKSANGELNHVSKEQNNYIGVTPPVITPIAYTLELGNEGKVMAFVKRILGLSPKGDRLTIGSG